MSDIYKLAKDRLLAMASRTDEEKDAAVADAKERSKKVAEKKKQNMKVYQHRWYLKNKKKVARATRERMNSVHGRQVRQKWKEDNAAAIKARQKEYHDKNKEKILSNAKKYREENAKILYQKRQERYKADPEKFKNRSKAYYAAHAEEERAKARMRYARRKAELERLRACENKIENASGIQAEAYRHEETGKQKVGSQAGKKGAA